MRGGIDLGLLAPRPTCTELRGGDRMQGVCDLLILSHYCIGSFGTRVSECARIGKETPDLWVETTWANAAMSA